MKSVSKHLLKSTLTIRPDRFRLLEFEKEIEGASKVDWDKHYNMQDLNRKSKSEKLNS